MAGAVPAVVVGPDGYALFAQGEPPTRTELVERHFGDHDLVLVEGFRSEPGPTVIVHRAAVEPKVVEHLGTVVCAVTDAPLGYDIEILPGDWDAVAGVLAGLVDGGGKATLTAVPVSSNEEV
jgi:molybdopterin-guanine dinucleotide biosynthesis protein